ncbi:MAG: hypothetical protein LBM94_03520 [Propionibacteriaceae bacterium]|jgi:hypothetical protein|nr:hypothetical protein [Propionibacteriaceae bacterium]
MITQDPSIPFSLTVTTITATAVLSVLGLGYLLLGWTRKRSWRTLVRGAGFVLLPIGLFFAGLMDKFYDGVNALLGWAETTVRTIPITVGLSVAGTGLLLYVVGSFIPPVIGEVAKERRAAIAEKKAANGAPALSADAAPAVFGTPATAAPTQAGPVPAVAPAGGNDDEIDAILRKHGIA